MSYIETNNQFRPAFRRFRFTKMAGKGPGKKLFSSLLESDESDIHNDDTIKVFLRLKPSRDTEEFSIIEVIDSRTVIFKMPPEHAQFKKKLNMPDEFKYTFSNIYRDDATQGEVFTGCVAPLVKDLFRGQNGLLFTYGTTNAGKTFTVLGTGDSPGIIPRTLTTVFKSIKGKEYGSPRIKPDMFNAAVEMTDSVLEEELIFKKKILSWNPERTMIDPGRNNKTSSSRPSAEDYMGETVFREMQKRLSNDTSIVEYQADSQDRFSVWVSFGEIYNENIYDLLLPVDINRKRKALKLAQDKRRNVYIKGLKHVFVQSEEEAYKVLMFGKNNLQVAATGMNLHSSRSHCIFSVKLIKIPNVEKPERVVVSSFAICDLAGAERQKKTLNVGLRLKESQNINCSLHVLSRCFTVLRDNQLHNRNELIPFRDSKLTQLFQHALMGKESVTMIVNVNQEKDLCEETQHVLKATAVAKHIVVLPRIAQKPPRLTRTSMFSQIVSRHGRSTLIRWDSCVKRKVPEVHDLVEDSAPEPEEESQLQGKEERYETLLILVENLKEKLQNEKTKHLETKQTARLQEERIREEMCSKFDQLMKEAQENNEHDKKRTRQLISEIDVKSGENTRDNFHPSKLAKIDEQETLNSPNRIKELCDENKNQKLEIEGLIDFVNVLREEKKELTMELTSTKMNLGWREQEIFNLKHQIEIFGEEEGLKAAYVALQKEMEEKLQVRDKLLDEARADLLEELSAKEDLEEELVKLEKELMSKEEEIIDLKTECKNTDEVNERNFTMMDKLSQELNNVEEELSGKNDTISKLQLQVDGLKQELEKLSSENNNLQQNLASVTQELSGKNDTISKLQLQVDGLKQELEKVSSEKNNLQQNLACVTQEYGTYKEELSEKNDTISKLQLQVDGLKQELKKVLAENNNLQQNLACVTQEHASYKEETLRKLKEIDNLKSNELEIDNMVKRLNDEKEDLNKEISTLEQSLKHQIQETTRIMKLKSDSAKEVECLHKELTKAKNSSEELSKQLKTKTQKLTCVENEAIALQTKQAMQKQELDEYRRKDEDNMASIRNLEQEMVTFQGNQKAIISKYEQQLQKTKEENVVLKGEVAKVTTTFNKLTPTPKKDLEKKIEELKKIVDALKKELEDSQQEQSLLKKERDILVKKLKDNENKENEDDVFVNKGRVLSVPYDTSKHRAHSVREVAKPKLEEKTSRSTSKVGARKTRATCVPVDDTDSSHDLKIADKPARLARRRLLDTASTIHSLCLDDNEDEIDIPLSSPGSEFQHRLRARLPK